MIGYCLIGDFNRIDPEIFAPAALKVKDESTGGVYAAGRVGVY